MQQSVATTFRNVWNELHRLDGEPALAPAIEELHCVGGRDDNVPPPVVQSFARRHPGARVIEIADFDHLCCWIERWPQLLAGTRGAAKAEDDRGGTASALAAPGRR